MNENSNEQTEQRFIEFSGFQMSYETIGQIATSNPSFAMGLKVAAMVCRSQGTDDNPCPSTMAAVYLESLSNGEMP